MSDLAGVVLCDVGPSLPDNGPWLDGAWARVDQHQQEGFRSGDVTVFVSTFIVVIAVTVISTSTNSFVVNQYIVVVRVAVYAGIWTLYAFDCFQGRFRFLSRG